MAGGGHYGALSSDHLRMPRLAGKRPSARRETRPESERTFGGRTFVICELVELLAKCRREDGS